MQQKISLLDINDIEFGERRRQDYGEIEELAESIKENGMISSCAVKSTPKKDKPYLLLAGGRRFRAATLAEIKTIPCVIYDEEIDYLKVREIELIENTQRKDMHFSEKAALTLEIHDLQQQKYGVKSVGGPNVGGHSIRDTAKLLGRSHGSVSEELNLAKQLKKLPELKSLKNASEVQQFIKKAEKHVQAEEVKKTIAGEKSSIGVAGIHRKLITQYNIIPAHPTDVLQGGFFDYTPTLKDSIVDMVILDIPYALADDVSKEIMDRSAVSQEGKIWLKKEHYIPMLKKFLAESYRLLKPNTWLIVWFGPEPWFEPTYQEILNAGFECSRNVGLWIKNKGFAHYPQYYLGNAHESFFYARKGQPKIAHQNGKTNLFHYSVPHHTARVHQTEKPVELEQDIMSTFLLSGSSILVPCLGSGNTILAAANLSMNCFGSDVEQQFKDGFINNVVASEPPLYKTKKGE